MSIQHSACARDTPAIIRANTGGYFEGINMELEDKNIGFLGRMVRFYANEPIHLASLILSITAIIISCLVFAKG